MRTVNRNGGAYARTRDTAESIEARLREGGRLPVAGQPNGNVRTYLWVNLNDGRVPVQVEQMRMYSTATDYGTSRGLEASDMVHVLAALDDVEWTAKAMNWPAPKVEPVDPGVVLETLDRGDRQPAKTFVSGNAAALVWANPAADDWVFKVELFAVSGPGLAERFFGLELLGNVRKCYQKAARFIDDRHAVLRRASLIPARPTR